MFMMKCAIVPAAAIHCARAQVFCRLDQLTTIVYSEVATCSQASGTYISIDACFRVISLRVVNLNSVQAVSTLETLPPRTCKLCRDAFREHRQSTQQRCMLLTVSQ